MNTKTTPNQKSASKSSRLDPALYEDDILDSLGREDEVIAERARVRGVAPAVVALDPDLSVAPRGKSEATRWSEAVQVLAASLNSEFWGMVRVAHHACFLGRECITFASTDRDLYSRMVAWAEGYRCALTHVKLRHAAAARHQLKN